MPYDEKSGQATAAFMNIKRKKGLAAAKSFGKKHAADLSAAAKSRKPKSRSTGYKVRSDQEPML